MAIVYRVTNAPNTGSSFIKNTTLTYAEGDGNFAVLENLSSSYVAFIRSYNTGSFTGSFTGSLLGTASYANHSNSASYAATSSYAKYAETSSYATSFTVANTLTAQTIVVQTITSSVEFVTGSTRFGSLIGNTHIFTGSVSISGSITGTNGVVNNLTASWAISSSYASNSVSGSYAISASYSNNSTSASYSNNSTSASYALTASYSNNSTSASYALTSSYSKYAETSSYATSFSVANNLVVGGTITSGGTAVVLGSGTTNTVPKFTAASTIGDSNIKDNGTVVSINATAGSFGALQVGSYNGNILMNTNNTSAGLIFQNTDSSNKLWDFTSAGNNLSFNESNIGVVMLLQAGGNVGIRQPNPTAALHVSGTVRFPDLTSTSGLSNIVMTDLSTGQLHYTASSMFVTNINDTYAATPAITNIITLSAAEYSSIGAPSSNTLYVII
jgi:hypothetical protein